MSLRIYICCFSNDDKYCRDICDINATSPKTYNRF